MQTATRPLSEAVPVGSKHWDRAHILALAITIALIALVAFEAGHWMAEGMPPPADHLGELLDKLPLAAWLWG